MKSCIRLVKPSLLQRRECVNYDCFQKEISLRDCTKTKRFAITQLLSTFTSICSLFVLAFILNLYTVQLSEDKRRTQVVWIVRIQKAWRLSVRPNCMLIACDIVRTKFRFSFPSVIFYGRMFEDSE